MNKATLPLILSIASICLSAYSVYALKSSPPMEENIKVRIGQSDRFLAENANNITVLKLENENLKRSVEELQDAVEEQGRMLRDHSALLKARR
jgi:hypothetical protein